MNIIKRNGSEAEFDQKKIIARALEGDIAPLVADRFAAPSAGDMSLRVLPSLRSAHFRRQGKRLRGGFGTDRQPSFDALAERVTGRCAALGRATSVEEVQDFVKEELHGLERKQKGQGS